MMLVAPSWSMPMKLCGVRAECVVSSAICKLPSVPFWNSGALEQTL
jgi:hypothetical protein